ncbi:MAG: cytochrome-c oxidase, cbb3-type subunit II [Alcanivorax sp.]|jgi:cytochrome c oxidase cbb3-type subunit 2|uniref:cytochrome-c oxidase, cbb3-type subunit II n=1 Tax=Alcanivorax sp. TaxID=1872427 RepID=UPI0019A2CE08|nr:cytochrome-c oxidase, cbb3-type subunit II [Alcanivorax sp.]MBD3645290.1 cytochrome-c oxidase, cbb3-type subunit II [Alcanivorax sp.]MDF1723843.1 cytochrome-c oxidase, cbb3-type subunit II [Alcanivorax sp.]
MSNAHERVEKNVGLMIVLTLIAVSFGGLAEIVPLFWQKATTEPLESLEPYTALEMEGRDIYIREGCHVCHTQMVRPLRAETERYGAYSVAGEDVWEHPFLWGSKRTGPDLARVGLRPITEQWHREHLRDPRQVVPESNMPAYPWLQKNLVDWTTTERKLRVFKDTFGVPYSDQDIAEQLNKIEGEWANATEEDALVAYLLSLGQERKEVAQ